jgi:aquaporin Z
MVTRKKPSITDELRSLFAEICGTFALTFVGVGAAAIALSAGSEIDFTARVAAPALMVMALVYSLGEISGMHINPVVTLAFAIRTALPWRRVPGYIVAQLAGAIIAAITLQYVLHGAEHLGAPLPHVDALHAVVMEAILTFFLVTVVIGTASGSKIVGSNAGIAVGGTVGLCAVLGAMVSGGSMNPALSFGSLLIAGRLDVLWIYIAGPTAGAVFAVTLNYLTHGKPTKHELETANGKPEQGTLHK